jgi:folate-binding protein YgfZ
MGDGSAEALAMGNAFIDLSSWRKVGVSGADAPSWLNDLISVDIQPVRYGRARRSLLLSPTGGVRAEFTVAMSGEGLLLIQDPIQPRSVLELLQPYVLSADVELQDRTDDLVLFAFPGRPAPPDIPGTTPSVPSCVGIGADLLGMAADHRSLAARLGREFLPVDLEGLQAWRIAAGIPRVGVDVTQEDLPQEGGLGDAVSFEKGCYLGQEAVAKVRNLGHPRRVLLKVEARQAPAPGDAVHLNGVVVGAITSAAGTLALAKVRWAARGGPLRTPDGAELRIRT